MIEVSNVSRFYGSFPALDDVSFSLQEGLVTGIIGLNGAGKSTALKILAGLMDPSAGTVTMNGADVSEATDTLRASIGYLPETPPLYTNMSVRAFLKHAARLKGMSSSAIAKRLPDVLRQTDLTDRAGQIIGTLSHGYRKRVGIAMAIIHDPKLVILDEPISGLDPVQIRSMREVIRGLTAGRAVLLSSHILTEIALTCDHLILLHHGRVLVQGSQEEILARAPGENLEETFVKLVTEQGAA